MSSETSDRIRTAPRAMGDWEAGYPYRGHQVHNGHTPGLILTSLVMLGLGAVAWNYFGPDLRRYIKLSKM
jgi:hypothetical protein